MKVVDHINLLGVKLARTTTKTRELTGSDLVSSVQSKINHFKAGRHSALVLKPHLANVYLLSKISHKAAAVHLRSSDVQKLQSAIKGWVSQELLKKPKELLLYRSKEDGGLGLVNVQARAMANLTRSFLQSVLSSPYSSAIYKVFVKDDEDVKQFVKKPSFYPEAMYASVKEALRDLGGQIFSLTAKQWQTRLTENLATHVRVPTSGIVSLLPSPAEESWPDSNWSQSRLNLSLKGLSPNQRSTLFKLSNDLFPHSEQLQKFNLSSTAECQFCKKIRRSSPFLHLCPGNKSGILPPGLPVPDFLQRRSVLLAKGEDSGSFDPFSSGQTRWSCSDSRSCQPHPNFQKELPSRLPHQAGCNPKVQWRGGGKIFPQRGNLS